MTTVEKKSRGSRFVAYALIGIMLTAMGYGMGVWSAPVTSFGIDGSGNLHANEIHVNDVVSEGDVHTSSLYVNGEKYYPETPVSYTVWNSTGTIYSKNGLTGAVTSNANAATLINGLITTLGTNGGIIHLKLPITITAPLNLSNSRVILEGDSFVRGNSLNVDVGAGEAGIVLNTGDASGVWGGGIKDLSIANIGSSGFGVMLNDTDAVWDVTRGFVKNVYINNFTDTGLYIGGKLNKIEFSNINISGSTHYGLKIDGTTDGNPAALTFMDGLYIDGGDTICLYAEYLTDGVFDLIYVGGATGAGYGANFVACQRISIGVIHSEGNAGRGIQLDNLNKFWDVGTIFVETNVGRGIEIYQLEQSTINSITETGTSGGGSIGIKIEYLRESIINVIDYATSLTITANMRSSQIGVINALPTKNSGVAPVYNTNTTCVITHGLYTTPTLVTISTSWAGAAYVSAVGATTFTVTFTDPTATKAIYWQATYKP